MPNLIVIDGPIGSGAYSKQLIRTLLSQIPVGEPVDLEISSLGGSVDHAIAIHNMFAERGNIRTRLTGFIASAATYAPLPTYTLIADNSFYLIHKVLSWIDIFGRVNEDDIDQIIETLTKEKNENAKMTLVIAQGYTKRASKKGKTINDVLQLMKLDTWITAQEALEWGFVDEVYTPDTAINTITNSMVAMAQSFNLPSLPTTRNQKPETRNPKPETINSQPETNMKSTIILPHINEILSIPELIVDDNEGSFIMQEQLTAIEARIQEQATTIQEQATSNQEQATRIQDLALNVQQLTAINTELEARNPQPETSNVELTARIAELETTIQEQATRNTELETRNSELEALVKRTPSTRAILLQADADPDATENNTEDWAVIDSLPHNQFVDNQLS
jgi:ATP-dependent protease ClpP protease subunit